MNFGYLSSFLAASEKAGDINDFQSHYHLYHYGLKSFFRSYGNSVIPSYCQRAKIHPYLYVPSGNPIANARRAWTKSPVNLAPHTVISEFNGRAHRLYVLKMAGCPVRIGV